MPQFAFKLMSGGYECKDPTKKNEDGSPVKLKYKIGDIIETDIDLAKKFGPEQFLLVAAGPRAKKPLLPTANVPPKEPAPPPPVPPGQQAGTTADNDQDPRGSEGGDDPATAAELTEAADKGSPIDQYEPLEQKTVAQLKEIAETEEIDISGLKHKDEIVKALRAV